ncbi:MAG: MazG nucleotide pyrophosphohydrolase domain-containing protein [Acidimicrobiales bacterium]|nr:MazG nucleotide pyrophosphohydrolase domain-containing protein [Acidimicrobiales bacterium]
MSDGADRPRVVVVGLGPAGPELTTVGARDRLATIARVHLRTYRHPAAEPWSAHPSFDHVYERAGTFHEVYRTIADVLVSEADVHGEVAYAIPGSPFVLERTVELLRDDARVVTEVVPGMSFLDLAWGRLGVDPVEAGVTLVDGHRFAVDAAGATGALLVAHCHAPHVLSEIKLAYEEDEPDGAVVLQRLGLPDESVTAVDWAELDRAVDADHLTSLFIPAVTAPVAQELLRFHGLVRTLRDQCPWDREQTHASLRRYVVEETYEVVDAIDGYDPETGEGVEDLEEELGDLLYQVFFHATIAAESGAFTVADVARGIHDKLHRRHPHVFGDASPDSIESDWEEIKKAEKGRGSAMDGIPSTLPGLLYASKVLSKAGRVGVPGPDPADPGGELGAALLAIVAHARAEGLDAEAELRRAADELAREAQAVERSSSP